MSRVSKIPARHQPRTPPRIFSVFSLPGDLAGLTTSEQADAHRAAYRSKCAVRRNGRNIEALDENGQWTVQDSFKFIARAKAATTSRRYTV